MSGSRPALGALLLFALNSWVCWALYGVEWLDQRASIEGAYIGLAEYIKTHPGEYRWFPLWYGGIPFQNAYPPLLHFLTAWTSAFSGWSAALAYHKLCAFFYVTGPVALYVLAGRLFRCWRTAWLAGLAYSALPWSIWLMHTVQTDMGVWVGPRRLQALVGWGEGPNVTALTLVPLAWWLVLEDLRRPAPWRMALAACACAAVALTNWLGCFTMAAGVLFLWWAERGGWRRVAGVALVAYALASPWIPPSTIAAVRTNAQVLGDYGMTWRNILALALLTLAAWAVRRGGFAVMLALVMTVLPMADDYWKFPIVPQAFRYHLVMELALSLVLAQVLARWRWRGAVAALAFCGAVWVCWQHREYSRLLILKMNAPDTWEYQAARWVTEQRPGDRVFAAGSTRLWWLAFSPNPQLDGGFFQGLTNQKLRDAFWLVTRAEPRDVWFWLRATGVRVVVAGTETTFDQYKDWRNTPRLYQVLKPLWESSHDVIFEVPGGRRSLAAVIARDDVPGAQLDLARYVKALDDPARAAASFTWRSAHTARIDTRVAPGEVVSVQVSYDRGWEAAVNGRPATVARDGLGQMAIDVPDCGAGCAIDLVYTGGWEQRIARWAQRAGYAAVLLLLGMSLWRKRHAPRLRN